MKLHERCVRLVYVDYELPFEKLLEKDGSFTVHYYNVQTLCIELYNVYHNIAQAIFSDIFIRSSNTYNIYGKFDFAIPQIKTVLKGSNSIRYYGPVICNLIPAEMKYEDSLETIKSKIRMLWKPTNCPRRICKTISLMLGFSKHLNKILSTFLAGYMIVALVSV